MDASIVIALIALAGSLFSTAATVFGTEMLQSRREAEAVLQRYREPLVAGAYELQARLHNILRGNFVEDWILNEKEPKQEAAMDSTLYVFAQFFGWREIIRREVQFLRLGRDEETREVARLLRDITETFLDRKLGDQFMIWRVEQRGFGERMIEPAADRPTCMGYAAFIDRRSSMTQWLSPLERDLKSLRDDGRARLTALQHQLLDLVRTLDADRTRYPYELNKA